MRDLSAPVRVTWDVPGHPALAGTLWRRLREGRVLFVDARVTREGLGGLPGLAAALAEGPGPRLAFTLPGPLFAKTAEAVGLDRLTGVEVNLLPPYPEEGECAGLAAGPTAVAASVWSTPQGLAAFPAALALAARTGVAAVAILNPPAPAEPLGSADRECAAAAWRVAGLEGRVALRCHDLFLAEALGLDSFQGYGGCQAAGFLAHLDPEGRLVACRTLPRHLGDLATAPLSEVWSSAERRSLRAALEAMPGPCAGCQRAEGCRGGCRGLSPDLGRDPSCALTTDNRQPTTDGHRP